MRSSKLLLIVVAVAAAAACTTAAPSPRGATTEAKFASCKRHRVASDPRAVRLILPM